MAKKIHTPTNGAPQLLNQPFVIDWQLKQLQQMLRLSAIPTEEQVSLGLERPDIYLELAASYAMLGLKMGSQIQTVFDDLQEKGISNIQRITAFYKVSRHPDMKGLGALPLNGEPVSSIHFNPLSFCLTEGLLRIHSLIGRIATFSEGPQTRASASKSLPPVPSAKDPR